MVLPMRRPAQLADALHCPGGTLLQIVLFPCEKFEGLLLCAAVTTDRPAENHLITQIRPVGRGRPLSGGVDQVTHLADLQRQRQIAAALDRTDQRIPGLHATALAGHLVKPGANGAAFNQGM